MFGFCCQDAYLSIMLRLLSLLFVLAFSTGLPIFSQTGPAGVGSSTNNAVWLKADAGTSSSANNTAISYWNDQSGNSVNATQTVSAQQPSFATSVINGFPAILFDNNSTSGQNDKMLGPDLPVLDNTSGYTFFTVTRPMNLDGNARVIVSKRTTVSVDESFMLFYYTSNKLTIDIETTDDRFASNMTYSNNVNFISCLQYNGSATTASRCALYSEETFDKYATETATLVPDHASPLILGSTDASDGRPYGGYTSEIIIYREFLAPAKRIIVNNYLSAKYNIALSANDKYLGDNSSNGDYDREVAGVGQESTGNNTSFSASVSGGLSLSAVSGLDNGDYILAGHAVATNTTITTDVGGMTGSNNARWLRVWFVDVTNTLTNIGTNIEFSMSSGGMSTFTLGQVYNYVLLYRAGQSGNWTELSSASAITGDRIQFNSITLVNDGYYTLGTRDYNNSPLPVQLLYFKAEPGQQQVNLSWGTVTEKHTNCFIIERSQNGIDFETVATVKAAGESQDLKTYAAIDKSPVSGLSYYRLTEFTTDGIKNHFPLVAVSMDQDNTMIIYPNPSEGLFTICLPVAAGTPVELSANDASGREVCKRTVLAESNKLLFETGGLKAGTYLLRIAFMGRVLEKKIILK